MQQTSITSIPTQTIAVPGTQQADANRQHSSVWFSVGEILLVLLLLTIAGVAHGISMLNNPFYLGDEGIYMSQAWAVVREGKFDPYTYTYGHAPIGWLQIALWILALGSFHTFGTSIETGRVLMLIYQLGSTLLLYGIARRISHNVLIAALTCLLFALSPYGIYLHRRVLLDNIMTFWMLLSVFLLLTKRLSLNTIWLSAIALAIGVLSKENAILIMPALAGLVFHRAYKEQRLFATIGWITLVCTIASLYVLMAVLKGELFPTGTLLGGTAPHVSLLGSANWQATRERDAGLFDLHSKFWTMTLTWAQAAPLLVIGGMVCSFVSSSLIFVKRYRIVGCMGLANLLLWLFLIRGSLVLEFYLAPELPFMALSIALMMWIAAKELKMLLERFVIPRKTRLVVVLGGMLQSLLVLLCLSGLLSEYSSPILGLQSNHLELWQTANVTQSQKDAITWIESHIPRCSSLVIDPYMWTELHETADGKSGYPLAHSYWQVELDPAIQQNVFHNDWRNVDYIISTPGMVFDTNYYQLNIVENALQHSTLIASFSAPYVENWHVNVYQVRKGTLNPGIGCKHLN